ncbi:MAG: DUF3794 domain-containing protein [Lachnospiraceae bacterium]|nr:DUF3794 domain-containing protein [Lachnospiraceae bacterium]
MELIKKNIHMDRLKCKASTQITLEDDINISDSRPDAAMLILNRGNVSIDEVKVTTDNVAVKGKLDFSVAYTTDGGGRIDLNGMDGQISFTEQLNMEGVESGDNVGVKWEVEDLTISLINSRKLSVQSIISLYLSCEVLSDEETAVDLYHDEPIEYRKKTLDIAAMTVKKKDIFRIKEEVEIPGSFPNISDLIWEDIRPQEVEFKVLDDKISVQGEIKAFFMYRSDGEEKEICHHETILPFSGVIECAEINEGMIPEISWLIKEKATEIRPDFDGEDRIVTFDLLMELDVCVYKEERIDILSDVYGVNKEVTAVEKDALFRRLKCRSSGKTKMGDHLVLADGQTPVKKILHSSGTLQVIGHDIVEDGVDIEGVVNLQVLYESNDENAPYGIANKMIPFNYTLNAEGINVDCVYRLQAEMEQLVVSAIEPMELDVKAVLCFRSNIYEQMYEKIIDSLNIAEPDLDKLGDLPGIAVYIAGPGESLWDIGKRYYIPISQLKEANDKTDDEVKAGDKILIVKNAQ